MGGRRRLLSKTPIEGQSSVTTLLNLNEDHVYDEGFDIGFSPQGEKLYQPFRYLGKKYELKDWSSANAGTYWDDLYGTWIDDGKTWVGEHLTASAYGDPEFPTLYPNCRSVLDFTEQMVTRTMYMR